MQKHLLKQVEQWDTNGLSKLRHVYLFASVNSLHVQRMLQGVAHFARIQSPPWSLRWGDRFLSLETIEEERIDGMIYFALPDDVPCLPTELGIPAVNVSSRNRHLGGAGVTPDDEAIGKLAAKHFKESLFSNFAYVGIRSHTYGLERFQAFQAAVAPFPCNCLFSDDFENRSTSAALEVIKNFLLSLPPSTAIFACNDIFARRVCEIAVNAGIAVPEDLAILGVDADEMISLASPVNLSSIDPDSFRIGYTAAEMLGKMIDDPSYRPGNRSIPPCRTIVAASSDHLATADKVVSKAVQTIRLHACRGLSVEAVAKAVGVGRRSLELRFKETLGRGVDAQIRKVRLERARELLERTDMAVGEVAEKSGFANIYYLSNVFKKNFGCSPTAYREQKAQRLGD